MNLTNFTKIFSLSLILIVFSFLINNYLTFAGEWPGPLSITEEINFFSATQTGLIFSINLNTHNILLFSRFKHLRFS